jgi:hypothetical protein
MKLGWLVAGVLALLLVFVLRGERAVVRESTRQAAGFQ